MTRTLARLVALSLFAVAGLAQAEDHGPRYAPDGKFVPPADYREWIYLSSGIDMSYRERGDANHSMFDNVFVDPAAYRAFVATGTWPDKTVLIMEVRGAATKGSINAGGKFQTADFMGAEAHVKDAARGGWSFFAFGDGKPVERIPAEASCYACHSQHGAVDTTFVQFYPTLIGIATQDATLSDSYRKEEAANPAKAAAK
jgi:hypothetical protein